MGEEEFSSSEEEIDRLDNKYFSVILSIIRKFASSTGKGRPHIGANAGNDTTSFAIILPHRYEIMCK